MKCAVWSPTPMWMWSLPVRGAWVEMPMRPAMRDRVAGRSPCGERGLKSPCEPRIVAGLMSLPVRGAWVEIT